MSTMFGVYAATAWMMTAPVVTVGMAPQSETTAAAEQKNPAVEATMPDPVAGASFDVNRFVMPEGADVLVVVEGKGGSTCRVYAYEKQPQGWINRVDTTGYLGKNGMSNNRTEGDKTTPIGLFQMNTPFGQSQKLEGFPDNYIQVDSGYVWEEDANRLSRDLSKAGERVGSAGYAGYYDYVLDAGYNAKGVLKKGSALFLHCEGAFKEYTSGCVAIPRDEMIKIMRLYGAYGDGHCYIAQAPEGTFDLVYNTYGINNGLSPDGDFSR